MPSEALKRIQSCIRMRTLFHRFLHFTLLSLGTLLFAAMADNRPLLCLEEVDVLGNSVAIADGDLLPTAGDHTDFGNVLACNGTIARSFTIQNSGTGSLTISNLMISGTNASDFTFTTSPTSPLGPGGNTTFQVTFDPSATGLRGAIISFSTNDCDEATYDFGIQGTGNADTVAPTINCPANITSYNDMGVCVAYITFVEPVGTDNCTAFTTLVTGHGTNSNYFTGTMTNTYQVSDAAGNTATCSFTVTVIDNELPGWTICPSNIAVIANSGNCASMVGWFDPLAYDNCSIASTTASHNPGSNFTVGATTVTYTTSDPSGNTSTCVFTVTVTDNEAPIAICQADSVQLDANGNGSTSAAAINNGSTDNCTIVATTLSATAFTCTNVGVNTVTLTVTDDSGNTSTCSTTVTVMAQPLNLSATTSTTPCGYNISCFGGNDGTVTATALGCPPYTYNWSSGGNTATVSGLGAGTHAVTVTDAAGDTAVVAVTLSTPAALQLNATATPTCLGEANGSIDLTVSGGSDCQGYTYDWSNGATTEDLSGLSPTLYTVTVTDAAGCSAIKFVVVPALFLPQPTFAQAGNLLTSTQTWSSYQWLLNGGAISGATGMSYLITQSGTYALQVTDTNGCSGTSTPSIITGIGHSMNQWDELVLFPTPTRNEFRLRSLGPISIPLTVSVTDLYGRRVFSTKLPALDNEARFDISQFAAGTYWVQVDGEEEFRKVFRLVVQ
jgi:hypothetical protein